MSLTVLEIDRMLSDLQQQYERDRETLLRMRELAARHQGVAPAVSTNHREPLVGRITPTRSGKKTDRQIIREFLAGWTGNFTIPDLMAAADRAGNKEAARIPQGVWSSTLIWLCQNGLTQVVEPRKGNKPGTYRVAVDRHELIAPRRRPQKRGFSVQAIVLDAIKAFPAKKFGKREISDFVLERCPEHKERLSYEVLASTIHRLGMNQRGFRIAERSRQGNVYEKLSE